MIRCRRLLRLRLMAASLLLGVVTAAAAGGRDSIKSQDLKEWLTYIASDDLEGRAVFTAGLGLAAAYIEDHLREWGVKPAGDNGSYLQTVRVLDVKSANHSTLTVEVAGQTRTFTAREGVVFPKNVGAQRRFTVDRVQFAGYGLDAPGANHEDFRGLDVKGAVVVWLGPSGPKASIRRVIGGCSRGATGTPSSRCAPRPPSAQPRRRSAVDVREAPMRQNPMASHRQPAVAPAPGPFPRAISRPSSGWMRPCRQA